MSRNYADPLQIMTLAQSHHTAEETARITGLAPYTVRQAAREMGVKFRDPRTPHPRLVEALAERRHDGATLEAIAGEFGMSKAGVRKVLLRAGVAA